MSGQPDLTGATVYRATGYPGARWHALDSGEVVLERPTGELVSSVLTTGLLASNVAKPEPTWYRESPAPSEG